MSVDPIDPKIMDHPDIGRLLKIIWVNGFCNSKNTKTVDGKNNDKPSIQDHIEEVLKLNSLRSPYGR